jgi:hypothetical protein
MTVTSYLLISTCSSLLGLIALSGCNNKPVFRSDRDTVVFVLFDVSGSTNSPRIRQRYIQNLDTIEKLLSQEGGTLRGDVIGSEALNTSTIPIDVSFPSYNPVFSTEKKHDEQIRKASVLLEKQAEGALETGEPGSQSAIMSSLEVASKILNGGQLKGARRKILVIFSDMVEESPRYKFPHEALTASRIKSIVDNERAGGRLPNLQGVTVWKAGASAIGLDDDRSRALQTFWIQYFKAAGADLEPGHYGSALLNFSVD